MQWMDGYEATRLILACEQTRHAHLSKPIDPVLLTRAIYGIWH
jgi:hypothetical protein